MISDKLVKIFDININLIGKGYLLSHSSETIMVKGTNLPILVSGYTSDNCSYIEIWRSKK